MLYNFVFYRLIIPFAKLRNYLAFQEIIKEKNPQSSLIMFF